MDRATAYRKQYEKNQREAQQKREQRERERAAAAAETARQVEALRRERGTLPPSKTPEQIEAELDSSLRPFLEGVLQQRVERAFQERAERAIQWARES